jgi:hypothetical protein
MMKFVFLGTIFLSAIANTAAGFGEGIASGKWQRAENTSLLTKKEHHSWYLESSNEIQGGANGAYKVVMMASCTNKSSGILFAFKQYMGPDLYFSTFRYRVDDGEINTIQSFSLSSLLVGLKPNASIQMLKKISKAKLLVISAPIVPAGEIEASFDIDGVAAIVDDVRTDCRW